jgi:minor extracellular serine protease Vpr
LAVAAYNSKISFTNIAGSVLSYTGYVRGRIAPFSSLGPTADGRTKPNIAGPGMALASSVSSYAPDYQPGGADYDGVVASFVSPKNNRTYAFGMAGGTSMSAPAVSGIVALLLQVNPQLSPQQVMNLLAQTAIKDANTGAIPAAGSNTWGFGKVNAYRAIKTLLEPTGIVHLKNTGRILVYPNPGNRQHFVEYLSEGNESLQISITDASGRLVRNETWVVSEGSNVKNLDLDSDSPGIYFLQLKGRKGISTVRILKH